MLLRAVALEEPHVAAVHGHDEVELREVLLAHLSRAHRAQVVAAPHGVRLRAGVGRLADEVVVTAGRRDLDALLQPDAAHEVGEDACRRGRAADVDGADEEDFHSEASATPNTRFFSSASWSRALAACSNSRFLACCSMRFSSALISRASCFSDMLSMRASKRPSSNAACPASP